MEFFDELDEEVVTEIITGLNRLYVYYDYYLFGELYYLDSLMIELDQYYMIYSYYY